MPVLLQGHAILMVGSASEFPKTSIVTMEDLSSINHQSKPKNCALHVYSHTTGQVGQDSNEYTSYTEKRYTLLTEPKEKLHKVRNIALEIRFGQI